MNNKTLGIIIGGIFIIFFGIYIYLTSAVNISSMSEVSYSGKLMPQFSNPNVSSYYIESAESKMSEVEELLSQVKEKDLSEYSFLHRQFLKNMINIVEERLEDANNKLVIAKESFQNGQFSIAGENAYLSLNIAVTLPRHLNNILDGRTKDEWNRLDVIENSIIPNQSIPIDENGEPIRNNTHEDILVTEREV